LYKPIILILGFFTVIKPQTRRETTPYLFHRDKIELQSNSREQLYQDCKDTSLWNQGDVGDGDKKETTSGKFMRERERE
jgi:hypothetical protein